jgi:hypothetical protein
MMTPSISGASVRKQVVAKNANSTPGKCRRNGRGHGNCHAGFASLAAEDRERQRVLYSSARLYRSLRDEFAELPMSLAQARSFQN